MEAALYRTPEWYSQSLSVKEAAEMTPSARRMMGMNQVSLSKVIGAILGAIQQVKNNTATAKDGMATELESIVCTG